MYKYKMIAYCLNGSIHTEIKSNNIEFLNKYKNKVNYRIQIFEKRKSWHCIYSEI